MFNLIKTSALIGFSILLISCSDNDPIDYESLFDFSGIYSGNFDCTGMLEESSNGESFEFVVQKTSKANEYMIDLGDDVVFIGVQNGDSINIEEQILNEGQGFDEVTLSGTLTRVDEETFNFEFTHNVDDEGMSVCNQTISLAK